MKTVSRLFTSTAVAAVLALVAITSPTCVRAEGEAASAPAQANPWLSLGELRTRYADRQGKYANIKGVEIYYKDEGKGPVLLMVHGSSSSLHTWDRIAQLLKSRYRVIRFDVAGMGLSGAVSDEAAANLKPVDIASGLMDQLGVKKLSFVGVSSGGTLGMFLAAARPDLVDNLILSNTPADPVRYGHMVQPESFLKAQEESRKAGGFQSRHFWDEFFAYFAGDPARISAQTRDRYYDMNRRAPEKHPVALVAQIADGVAANELMKQVTAPTLLIWGGKDPLLTIPAMHSLAAHLSSAQVSSVVMPDVGHYPPLEVPDRFAQLVSTYLEDVVTH